MKEYESEVISKMDSYEQQHRVEVDRRPRKRAEDEQDVQPSTHQDQQNTEACPRISGDPPARPGSTVAWPHLTARPSSLPGPPASIGPPM